VVPRAGEERETNRCQERNGGDVIRFRSGNEKRFVEALELVGVLEKSFGPFRPGF
jgi:hypothetical protein